MTDEDGKEDLAIRLAYEKYGVNDYYAQFGSEYRNPHESRLEQVVDQFLIKWQLTPTNRVLDLACGSGEITAILNKNGYKSVVSIDPFTSEAFQNRIGRSIDGKWTFEQIADGCLEDEFYDVIICSYAAHLISPSYLPLVMIQLALISEKLIILTPHKRPELSEKWGWTLHEEFIQERIRARLYVNNKFEKS